jgi:hypothetical protein
LLASACTTAAVSLCALACDDSGADLRTFEFTLRSVGACFGVHATVDLANAGASAGDASCTAVTPVEDGCRATVEVQDGVATFHSTACGTATGAALFTCELSNATAGRLEENVSVSCGCGCQQPCPLGEGVDVEENTGGEERAFPESSSGAAIVSTTTSTATDNTIEDVCCGHYEVILVNAADVAEIRFEAGSFGADPSCGVGSDAVVDPSDIRQSGAEVEACVTLRPDAEADAVLWTCDVLTDGGPTGAGATVAYALDREYRPIAAELRIVDLAPF